jgi:ABC-type bacteriocin/lantibiotic exporter with double-glycine peptidase domain
MTRIASLSVPHFKQEQGGSCTAACVRMVLAYYGRTHSEDELRQLLGTGPRGPRPGMSRASPCSGLT